MKAVNVLRSACLFAVACGLSVATGAAAQVPDKPAQQQARKAAQPVAAAKGKDKAVTRKAGATNSNVARKPKATSKTRAKPVTQAAAPKRPQTTAKSAPPKSAKPAATAAARRAQPAAAARHAQRPPLPPPVAWVPPPLGPERFYPNGIPELRPEFLHPERPLPARPDQSATVAPALGGHPELMP